MRFRTCLSILAIACVCAAFAYVPQEVHAGTLGAAATFAMAGAFPVNDALSLAVQQAVDAGRLTGTPIMDGTLVQKRAPASFTFDDATGWAFGNASPIGYLPSRGVERSRAELTGLGYDALAKILPVYHGIEFWSDGSNVAKGFATRDNRFAPPDDARGLSDDQIRQLLANIEELDHVAYAGALVGSHAVYRGVKGTQGFAPVVPGTSQVNFSPSPPPNYKPDTLYLPGEPGSSAARVFGANGHPLDPPLVGHFTYRPGWNGLTDENVTRYWRSFAISRGADPAWFPLELA